MGTQDSGNRRRSEAFSRGVRQHAPANTGEIGFGTHNHPSGSASSHASKGRNKQKVSVGRVFQNRERKQSGNLQTALLLALALVCVAVPILLRTLLCSPVRVSGAGMAQSVKSGEVVLLDRTAYWKDDVRRFDIVLCKLDGKDMFRRVIGMPGEIVQIEQGVVYVDGRAIRERADTVLYVEDFGPVAVPKGQYFVLGDNRPIAMDSRTAGMVAESKIHGRAARFLLPMKKLWQTVNE